MSLTRVVRKVAHCTTYPMRVVIGKQYIFGLLVWSITKGACVTGFQHFLRLNYKFVLVLLISMCFIFFILLEPSQRIFDTHKSHKRRGVFWIYGDSVGDFFFRAIWNTPFCKELFHTCQHTYNWVYKLPRGKPPSSALLKYDFRDFDEERLIHEITDVITNSMMTGEESAMLLNLGLHYSMGISVVQLIQLMDKVSATLRDYKEKRVFNGTLIWKTTTALQKWKYGSPESNARHAKSHRFLTAPVSLLVL